MVSDSTISSAGVPEATRVHGGENHRTLITQPWGPEFAQRVYLGHEMRLGKPGLQFHSLKGIEMKETMSSSVCREEKGT